MRWQSMASKWLRVLLATSIKEGCKFLYPVGWLWAIRGDLGTHVRLYTARWEYQPHLSLLPR